MSHDYDVIIIGGGTAGEHCSAVLAKAGLKVAIVERELVAGECSYWACIPSKTLLRPGEAIQAAREAPGAREAVSGKIDPRAAFAWRDFMVSDYSDAGQVEWMRSAGVDLIRGSGALAGAGAVMVGERTYSAREVVISTGSDPVIPEVAGLEGLPGLWTNREATGLKEVPRRLLILGAGPVGVEMAQAIHRLGAEVALVASRERVLPHEPPAIGDGLGRALGADGIELHFNQRAQSARFEDGEYVLTLTDGAELRGDKLLVATGRRPRTGGLELAGAGVEVTDGGAIAVDAHMRAAEGVWAIGDVTGIYPLTYVGKYQGRVAAANILGEAREASYDAVPRVVFTDPQAASVGEPDGVLSSTVPLSEVPRTSTYTRAYDSRPGFLTLVSDGERLTGAHALGPEAGEWLQQATLAIRARVPLSVLHDTIQPFPTFSEAFLFALNGLAEKAG